MVLIRYLLPSISAVGFSAVDLATLSKKSATSLFFISRSDYWHNFTGGVSDDFFGVGGDCGCDDFHQVGKCGLELGRTVGDCGEDHLYVLWRIFCPLCRL